MCLYPNDFEKRKAEMEITSLQNMIVPSLEQLGTYLLTILVQALSPTKHMLQRLRVSFQLLKIQMFMPSECVESPPHTWCCAIAPLSMLILGCPYAGQGQLRSTVKSFVDGEQKPVSGKNNVLEPRTGAPTRPRPGDHFHLSTPAVEACDHLGPMS